MAPGSTEDLDQQVRAPVDDRGRPVEAGGYIHHAEDLDDPLDPAKIAEFSLQGREDRQGRHPRRLAALLQGEIAADLAAHHLITRDRAMPAHVHQPLVDDAGEVVTSGGKRRRKLDPQGIEPVSDRPGALVRVLAQLAVAEPEHGVADADDVLFRQHLAGDPLAVDVGPAVGTQVDDLEAAVRVTVQLSVMPGDIKVPGQRDVVIRLPPDPDRLGRPRMRVRHKAILRRRRNRVRCHSRFAGTPDATGTRAPAYSSKIAPIRAPWPAWSTCA